MLTAERTLPEGVPGVSQSNETTTSQQKCPYCGGSDIVAKIVVGRTAEAAGIGPQFKLAVLFWGAEPMLADLCNKCGAITRLHVQNLNHEWIIAR